jgi:benzodiazapine receptor
MTTTARTRPSRARSATGLAASLAAVVATAAVGGSATDPGETWYRDLDKPAWQPPGAVFGPVWGVLYASQAVAAWLVWRAGGADARPALRVHGAQLLLNAGWSVLFFGLHRVGWALLEIAVLWIAIAATIRRFRRHSTTAGWLMVPYLVWVTFAAALTAAIWRRNR